MEKLILLHTAKGMRGKICLRLFHWVKASKIPYWLSKAAQTLKPSEGSEFPFSYSETNQTPPIPTPKVSKQNWRNPILIQTHIKRKTKVHWSSASKRLCWSAVVSKARTRPLLDGQCRHSAYLPWFLELVCSPCSNGLAKAGCMALSHSSFNVVRTLGNSWGMEKWYKDENGRGDQDTGGTRGLGKTHQNMDILVEMLSALPRECLVLKNRHACSSGREMAHIFCIKN